MGKSSLLLISLFLHYITIEAFKFFSMTPQSKIESVIDVKFSHRISLLLPSDLFYSISFIKNAVLYGKVLYGTP